GKQIWREVTAALKPTWFQGSEAVLACYCQTVLTQRQLAGLLGACDVRDERWAELIRLHVAVVGSLISVATKLRLTPQSSRDSTKLAPIVGGRPWEDDAP